VKYKPTTIKSKIICIPDELVEINKEVTENPENKVGRDVEISQSESMIQPNLRSHREGSL
jgi:hypothetical protein